MTNIPGMTFSLSFDVPGQSLHCPMVTAAIGGCTTRLIVDTGATTHLLTTGFAERAGVHLEQAEPGRDVAGDAVPSWSTGNVAVEIDNAGLVHLAHQELEIGPVRIRLDDLAVRDAIPAPDDAAPGEEPHALVGMDLLVGTVLVIAPRDEGGVWWIVPG